MADSINYFSANNLLYLTDSTKKVLACSLTTLNLIYNYFSAHFKDFSHFKYDFANNDSIIEDELDIQSVWYDNTKNDGSSIVSHETIKADQIATLIIDDQTFYIYSYKLDDGADVTPSE